MNSRNKRKENDLSKRQFKPVKRVRSVVCAIVTGVISDELMKLALIFFILFMLGAMFGAIGCAHSPEDYDANGICALDFPSKQCWIEKSKNQGMSFGELELQNSRCDQGPPDLCWFAINHVELVKLLRARDRLKECEGE